MPSTTWKNIIADSRGQYHVYSHTLGTENTLEHDADAVVEAASVIKLPILLLLLDRVQAKELSLRQTTQIHRRHVGRNGSGLLAHMHFEAPFTLYNLAFLMMSVSDNVATNVLIELLGLEAINAYLESHGLPSTRLVMDKIDFPANYTFAKGPQLAHTTPREMGRLVELLLTGSLLDEQYTHMARRFMQQVRGDTVSRRLPYRSIKRFGSKPGWIGFDREPLMILNECGFIIDDRDRVHIISIFAKVVKSRKYPYTVDSAGKVEFAKLAAALYTQLETASYE